jgi:hypothetical protein
MSQYFQNNNQFDFLYKVPRGTLCQPIGGHNPQFGNQWLRRRSDFKWDKEIYVNEGITVVSSSPLQSPISERIAALLPSAMDVL